MIRMFIAGDIDRVMEIWLDSNKNAHSFIPAAYWNKNFGAVKEAVLKAEVFVYENGGCIRGFIGLDNNYVEGIFVGEGFRSEGIGKSLMDFAKTGRESLSLSVYAKNERAVKFYLREGFQIVSEGTDERTNEKEYMMIWKMG
ncbi:MAG: GNAT family N-acetyltransferase [Oscillospiraceae bacterium]